MKDCGCANNGCGPQHILGTVQSNPGSKKNACLIRWNNITLSEFMVVMVKRNRKSLLCQGRRIC